MSQLLLNFGIRVISISEEQRIHVRKALQENLDSRELKVSAELAMIYVVFRGSMDESG